MRNQFDVIVVGSGPGGTTAARHLARAGLKTLLLEKAKMPRYKPCGGGVTAKVKNVLDVDFSPTVEDTISRASVAFTDQIRFPVEFSGPVGWSVMRDKFDALLAEQAAKEGAEVRDSSTVRQVVVEDDRVRVAVNGDELTSDIVVGADGANGIVSRATDLQPPVSERRNAAALEAEMELPNDSVAQWRGVWHLDFGVVPWGYAWIFPKAEHLSVGVGGFTRPHQKLNLRQLLDEFIASEPSLHNARHVALHGHTLPLGGTARQVSKKRVVLVGDSANLVDPFSGEGIYAAIKSGKLAAEHISRSLNAGETTFPEYDRLIQQEFTRDYRYAEKLGRVFYRAPVTLLRVYAQAKPLHRFTEKIAHADMDYHTLIGESLKRAPRFLLHKAAQRVRGH